MEQTRYLMLMRRRLRALVPFFMVLLACAVVLGGMPALSACFGERGRAFAEETTGDTTTGDPGETTPTDPTTPSDPVTPTEPTVPTAPTIVDVGIFYTQTDNCIGYASNPNLQTASISAKGATLQFDSIVYWSDGSSNRNASSNVVWSTSDAAIATVSQDGIMTAVGDGTVQITATVSGAYTSTGVDLMATAAVQVSGQTGAPYVASITIVGPDGASLENGTYTIIGDLSVAMAQMHALVDVVDPATGTTTTYSTVNGSLSSQVPELGNLVWYVGDSTMGTVDETSGLYRPAMYGRTTVAASSAAGLENTTVVGSAVVICQDPDGGETSDEYFPQESLTIKAYWELYPPEGEDDEDAYVINKTYSLAELEALGVVTQTYTAISSTSYYTMTGTGVPLSSVLENAGIDVGGITQFKFGTQDRIDRTVSSAFVFDTNRYYYPNIDIGGAARYTGAIQVYPILAFQSNEIRNGSTEPNYDMSEATRFRLLFGSTPDGGTSSYQIKWIHTLYVVLAGGPPVEPDQPGGDDESGNTPGSGDEGNGTGDTGTGSGSGSNGSGEGAGLAAGSQGGAESGDSQAESGESGESGGDDGSAGEGGAGAYSVYQIMSTNETVTETTLDSDNPYKGLVVPLGVATAIVGGVQSAVWYRRQVQSVALPAA